jgi:hypothetical protein
VVFMVIFVMALLLCMAMLNRVVAFKPYMSALASLRILLNNLAHRPNLKIHNFQEK